MFRCSERKPLSMYSSCSVVEYAHNRMFVTIKPFIARGTATQTFQSNIVDIVQEYAVGVEIVIPRSDRVIQSALLDCLPLEDNRVVMIVFVLDKETVQLILAVERLESFSSRETEQRVNIPEFMDSSHSY